MPLAIVGALWTLNLFGVNLDVITVLGIVSLAVHGEPGSLRMLPWSSTGAPAPMDPDRRVAEQDCTQPVDPAAGNLRCR